jgi:hypothetical protein
MKVPSLRGPYLLSSDRVKLAVTQNSPGVYATGSIKFGQLEPLYVGRSDDDLAAQLLKQIGIHASFSYAYASSALIAYQMECAMYHAWKPRDNHVHPVKPKDSNPICPVCGQ